MRTGMNHLYIPGPTNVPERVRQAINLPMEDHRAPDFPALMAPLFDGLKRVFQTETGRVFIFPSSGTGCWEAAIQNTLRPGDRVLMANHGQFSMLWADMARRLGLDVDCVDVDWREGAPVEIFAQKLAEDRDGAIKAVFVTQSETATGVVSDVAAVRGALDAAGHDALLFVDGVSSIASIDFRMDAWGVDLAVAGSQKGLMLPPGLGFLGVSAKAWDRVADAGFPRAYFDLPQMAALNDQGYFPYTPPTPLLRGLGVALEMLFEEGLENVFARHHRLAEGVRRGVHALGLSLCAREPKWWSDTVSAVMAPEGLDARDVLKIAYERYNTSFGSGLTKVAGKVFRIGHLGDLNEVMCLAALSSAEMSLKAAGAQIELGAGVAAAQTYYIEASAPEVRIAAE